MTEVLKNVSKHSTKWNMHLNFMTPKGLKITPSNGKKREEQEKEVSGGKKD